MPTTTADGRTFDARPDRIDYRDRPYRPPLVSLPDCSPDPKFVDEQLPAYTAGELILNQGREGACTGFGLAAAINYLLWKRSLQTGEDVKRVSARMLYHMARIYDEWPGEDYEGSSCRGAMKGWHRHGVCLETFWPYRDRKRVVRFIKPSEGWQQDAALRPLGAYYRIEKDSIADLQAAVHEVGAIYVSATVHKGWFLKRGLEIPIIPMHPEKTGGHAFAIVGYNMDGFVVQNSWGRRWGYYGFAIMTYEDWIQHGSDAWVAVLGAPIALRGPVGRTRSSASLRDAFDGKTQWFWSSDDIGKGYRYRNPAVEPFYETRAYEHSVVLGNDGRPLNRMLDVANAKDAVRESALNLPFKWLSEQSAPKLALYAHGGLNGEKDSVKRIRVLAPYFEANGIYPLFITWRTGVLETLGDMIEDTAKRFFKPSEAAISLGLFEDIAQRLKDAKDRSVELICERLLVKAVWAQMKQNAAAAANRESGLALLAGHLATLKNRVPKLEIHLLGHSAGSILLGHLLDKMVTKGMRVSSLGLYAPACTVKFALKHYAPAVNSKVVTKSRMHFDILSDERDRADSVGPYGKSLLYLVSRALEQVHKMPLLGMQDVWNQEVGTSDRWHRDTCEDVVAWRKFAGSQLSPTVHTKKRSMVSDGMEMIPLAHGSFDNDRQVVTATLARIRGDKLCAKVENLHWF